MAIWERVGFRRIGLRNYGEKKDIPFQINGVAEIWYVT